MCASVLLNPTHGSGWMVQVLPIERRGTNLCACGASHKVGGEWSEATGRLCLDDPLAAWVDLRADRGRSGRLCLNDPPTAVGGIAQNHDAHPFP